jgi:preprotein translocase subunit Sec61beta
VVSYGVLARRRKEEAEDMHGIIRDFDSEEKNGLSV